MFTECKREYNKRVREIVEQSWTADWSFPPRNRPIVWYSVPSENKMLRSEIGIEERIYLATAWIMLWEMMQCAHLFSRKRCHFLVGAWWALRFVSYVSCAFRLLWNCSSRGENLSSFECDVIWILEFHSSNVRMFSRDTLLAIVWWLWSCYLYDLISWRPYWFHCSICNTHLAHGVGVTMLDLTIPIDILLTQLSGLRPYLSKFDPSLRWLDVA